MAAHVTAHALGNWVRSLVSTLALMSHCVIGLPPASRFFARV
jgi:hypothetical protein